MSLNSLFGGVYVINLDRRPDRLKEITKELDDIGLTFKRFPGIDRKPGIYGCGMSHLAVLKEARRLGLKNVLIFEDDFTFHVSKETFWATMNDFLYEADYDVLMLGYSIQHSKPHREGVLKVLEAQTASAYIVNQRFYDALIALYEEAMPLLLSTGQHWVYANDQVWKKLQPRADWFALTPRLGRQRPSWSDNSNAFMDHGV